MRRFEGWGVRLVTPGPPLAGRIARLGVGLVSSRLIQIAYYDGPAMHARLREIARAEPVEFVERTQPELERATVRVVPL